MTLQHPSRTPFPPVPGPPILRPCVLSRSGWLAEQPEEFRHRLAALGRWKTYRAGESLYAAGDSANALFGLEDGALDIAVPISTREMVNLHRAHPGFWIGDSALLSGMAREVSVTAHLDSLVFVIPAGALMRHLDEQPRDMAPFFRLGHANTALALQGLADILALPPRARFARLLLRLAPGDGVVRATQAELGAMAGMSRASFRRAFAQLLAAGVVRTEYGRVQIVDRKALEAEVAPR